MIKREHYIKQIRSFYDSDLIKIITGIRRCGKSVLLQQIKDEISAKTNNILFLNFEDRLTKSLIKNADQLINYVNNKVNNQKYYLFFDEIQNVDDWSDACKTLRLYGHSIFVTGSNSKLLSKEFTKELSGRYVSFRIKPFVYKEMVEYAKQLGKTISVTEYMLYGGFPKVLEFSDPESKVMYLNDLDETIVKNEEIGKLGNISKEKAFIYENVPDDEAEADSFLVSILNSDSDDFLSGLIQSNLG